MVTQWHPSICKLAQRVVDLVDQRNALMLAVMKTCLQALEVQAGFPADSANGQAPVDKQQWEQFLSSFRDRLKLLRLVANVGAAFM